MKRFSASALLAAAIGCSRLAAAPPSPAPRAVEPPSGLTTADVAITVRGDWFVPLVVQRVGGGGGVDVRADFRAWLGWTELREVRWIDGQTLRATVPRGVPAGLHALTLEGPFGSGVLAGAYEARGPRPAALAIESFALAGPQPGLVLERGQPIAVAATVSNTGELPAIAVVPFPAAPAVTSTGLAAATASGALSPVDLAGGASATFTWAFLENGSGPGSLSFSIGATGTDATTGASLSAPTVSAGPLVVQSAPSLSATASASLYAAPGALFEVKLVVTNSGGTAANGLAPELAFAGPGSARIESGPVPARADVAPGASASFTWQVRALDPGLLTIAASFVGVDALTGAALSTSAPAAAVTVTEVEPIGPANPFGDATPFTFVASFEGQIWLGPSSEGRGVARMNPDGSGAQSATWTIEADSLTTSPARNLSYLIPSLAGLGLTCHSIGTTGCTHDSTACGPDNEGARALFFSGTIAGVDWLGLAGATDGASSRYVYMTRSSFSPSSWSPDFAWVDVRAANTATSTRALSAARVFHDRVYLGYVDVSGTAVTSLREAPVLSVLKTVPALPGFDAVAGTDIVNLGAKYLPGLGSRGTPSNTAARQMIDAFGEFNDSLYAGNNGGIVYSATTDPQPCTSSACGEWADATPSAWAYAAKTSVPVPRIGDLEPADRAVPGFAALAGRLYAARNTTTGPQLWACSPSGNASPLQCDPGDWALLAANAAGDTALSQFNDAGNTAVALLAATPDSIYVGFDNAAGVRVFRGSGFPLVFRGSGGCAAGIAGCAGLGGNGFGAGAQRIFDARAVSWNGKDYLFVAGGTPPGAARVFRISP